VLNGGEQAKERNRERKFQNLDLRMRPKGERERKRWIQVRGVGKGVA